MTENSDSFMPISWVLRCLQSSSDLLILALRFDSTAAPDETHIVRVLIPTLQSLFLLMRTKYNLSSTHNISLCFVNQIMDHLLSAFQNHAWVRESPDDVRKFWASSLSSFHSLSLMALQLCHTRMTGTKPNTAKEVHARAACALLLRNTGVIGVK